MTEQPAQAGIDQWHRRFAVEGNNHTWDLAARPERSPAENQDMLYSAYAAAFHWSKVGTPLHRARAEITLAHVHALLGQAELALSYARRSLAFFENNEGEDWDLAFAYAEMAHAAATGCDPALHAKYYALAQEQGRAIKDEEDQRIFLEELSRIPSRSC
jgi:hypothetical protein